MQKIQDGLHLVQNEVSLQDMLIWKAFKKVLCASFFLRTITMRLYLHLLSRR